MRFSASWAIVAVAIFLATPKAANTQAPANSADSLPSSYAAVEQSACEPGAPRLLGPVIHARPIAEAEREESSLLRCKASPTLTPLRLNAPIFDHLFGGQLSPEAICLDGGQVNLDEVQQTGLAGIEAGETNNASDITPENDFFLHAGTACGTTAGAIRFREDH